MAISFTYQPYSGYTLPVAPVYNDGTNLLTSTSIDRRNYAALTDVYINAEKVTTLKKLSV